MFSSNPTVSYSPLLQADLSIHFIVVGGGIAGLACAIALRRVGHTVLVLERFTDADISQVRLPNTLCLSLSHSATPQLSHGGIRLPPNVSKILFHWGLEHALRQVSITSASVDISMCSSKSSTISIL